MNFENKIIHMSLGLPGPLWTPFERTIDLPASRNEYGAATLTLHALDLLIRPKASKYFQNFQNNKKWISQIWGARQITQMYLN